MKKTNVVDIVLMEGNNYTRLWANDITFTSAHRIGTTWPYALRMSSITKDWLASLLLWKEKQKWY